MNYRLGTVIKFVPSQCQFTRISVAGSILSSHLAVAQVYLGGHETPIHSRKGSGLAEISAMQGVAPPEACKKVSLEIYFAGLRGGAISALAVAQVYLGGHETPIRARKGSGLAEMQETVVAACDICRRRGRNICRTM